MRRYLFRAARLLVLPTIAVAFVLAFLPGRAELAARIYALVVAAVALGLMITALRQGYARESSLRPSSRRRAATREVPETLARIEQEVFLGTAGSFDLHFRLRPRLRELAGELLATRRGIDLDREPGRVRQLVGDTAWDLIQADRPAPEDRLARGIAIRDLDHVVESLEGL